MEENNEIAIKNQKKFWHLGFWIVFSKLILERFLRGFIFSPNTNIFYDKISGYISSLFFLLLIILFIISSAKKGHWNFLLGVLSAIIAYFVLSFIFLFLVFGIYAFSLSK